MNKRLYLPLASLLALTPACGESDGDAATGTEADSTAGDTTGEGSSTGSDTADEAGTNDGSTGSTGSTDGTDDSTTGGDGDSATGGDGDSATGGDGDSATGGDGDSASGGDGDSATSGDGDSATGGDGDSATGGDGDSATGGDGDGDSGTGGDGDTGGTGSDPNDDDDDGIPNDDDPFPNTPGPGVGSPNVVYPHTSSTLFTMDVSTYQVNQVGAFTFDSSPGSVTDVALDRFGVLYAVTFNDLFVCDAQTAACTYLADLPQSFNGLTMVPPGVLDPGDDTLVGIANSGDWYRIDVSNGQAQVTQIGSYGGNYTNSGDVFSIQGVGTYGAVNGTGGDIIVVSDPATGAVQSELGPTTGYSALYGLAGWSGDIFGFNGGGEIIRIDPGTGVVTEVNDTPNAWWGAGVFSILPE